MAKDLSLLWFFDHQVVTVVQDHPCIHDWVHVVDYIPVPNLHEPQQQHYVKITKWHCLHCRFNLSNSQKKILDIREKELENADD